MGKNKNTTDHEEEKRKRSAMEKTEMIIRLTFGFRFVFGVSTEGMTNDECNVVAGRWAVPVLPCVSTGAKRLFLPTPVHHMPAPF